MPEGGAECPAGDLSDRRIAVEDLIAGATRALALSDEADEHGCACGIALGEARLADEVLLLGDDDAAEAGLCGDDVERQLVPVERHPGLEAKRVAGGESGRHEAVRLAGREQGIPQSAGVCGADVELEAVLTRVARARDEQRSAAE